MAFSFSKLLTNIIAFPSKPGSGALARKQFQDMFDEVATGINKLMNPPMCSVYSSIEQSIPDNVDTPLNFNVERFDTDNIHDNAPTPARLTCKTAGKYRISACVNFTATATGYTELELVINSTSIIAKDVSPANSAIGESLNFTILYNLAVGDYVHLTAKQSSGGSLNLASSINANFSMHRIGD